MVPLARTAAKTVLKALTTWASGSLTASSAAAELPAGTTESRVVKSRGLVGSTTTLPAKACAPYVAMTSSMAA